MHLYATYALPLLHWSSLLPEDPTVLGLLGKPRQSHTFSAEFLSQISEGSAACA